ncbi:otospiralin [Amia ocellicauda]|uniref:otospiralin n=1 Tax=Amia ocellicauda TaxID=2972642 RepID=UPI0034639E5A
MKCYFFIGIFFVCFLVNQLTDAAVIREGVPYDEVPAPPYWPYSTTDFWHYVEYFRTIGAYNRIEELARTFFAHQHLGDTLGYDAPQHEH